MAHARRRWIGPRHHLGPGQLATNAIEAAGDMVGLHASDPMSVYLAAWARVDDFQTADLDRALYEDRSLLKILGMRRTMFVVPVELAAVIQAACTDSIARGERARLHRMIQEAGITPDPERWLDAVERETLEVLDTKGEATAAELTKEVAGLRAQIPFGAGRRWQGTVGVSTRLLFLLASEGRMIRGRPKGGITSSLYRWTPIDRWVPGGLRSIPKDEAQVELVRRYLSTYGPATEGDIAWWTGWTLGETREAIAASDAVAVELEAGAKPGFVPRDWDSGDRALRRSASTGWVTLLPALDPTVMGWQARDWYLGPHKARLYDTNGNAGPTIWLDGRIVGGWAQRADGSIVHRLLEDVGSEAVRAVEAKAASLEAWLGPIRFIPRFRTPLERELVA
jgi:hypothetical protein